MGKTIRRKATFNTEVVKGERQFTPVNKRAKEAVAKIKKSVLTRKDLKAVKKQGYSVAVYYADNYKNLRTLKV